MSCVPLALLPDQNYNSLGAPHATFRGHSFQFTWGEPTHGLTGLQIIVTFVITSLVVGLTVALNPSSRSRSPSLIMFIYYHTQWDLSTTKLINMLSVIKMSQYYRDQDEHNAATQHEANKHASKVSNTLKVCILSHDSLLSSQGTSGYTSRSVSIICLAAASTSD